MDVWTTISADSWPEDVPPAPESERERHGVFDGERPFGIHAFPVEIRECPEAEKGRGVYATADIAEAAFLGIYWGERLTRRQYEVRHRGREEGGEPLWPPLTPTEETAQQARRARLEALPQWCQPMGGADNCGAYAFGLVPQGLGMDSQQHEQQVAYVDAEDPTVSSWNRFLNHCESGELGCNLEARHDASRSLLWFMASRRIAAGEELQWCYVQDRCSGLVNLLENLQGTLLQGRLSGPRLPLRFGKH